MTYSICLYFGIEEAFPIVSLFHRLSERPLLVEEYFFDIHGACAEGASDTPFLNQTPQLMFARQTFEQSLRDLVHGRSSNRADAENVGTGESNRYERFLGL